MNLFNYSDFVGQFVNESFGENFGYIRTFRKSREEIETLCIALNIENYAINDDGSVDVNGDVYLYDKRLIKIPLKFGKVTGDFRINNNKLVSLEGCPYEVGGILDFYSNSLTSLVGCAQKVGGYFSCSYNNLVSLEGCPKEVGGKFHCHDNKLTSLKGSPNYAIGFDCSKNRLNSLEGSPYGVGGDFDCSDNKLTSLKGCPKEVGGDFDFRRNKLMTLEGGPQTVERLTCSYNKIKDVKGFPGVLGELHIIGNPVYEIFKLFPKERRVESIEYLNEYDVIRDGNKVVMQALELVYDDLGLEVPDDIKIEGYEII